MGVSQDTALPVTGAQSAPARDRFGPVIACAGCERRFRQSRQQRWFAARGQPRFFCGSACVAKTITGAGNGNYRHGLQSRALRTVLSDVFANRRMIKAILQHGGVDGR